MQVLHSETGLCQNKIGLLFDHQHFGGGGEEVRSDQCLHQYCYVGQLMILN